MERYKILEELGDGTCGSVYKAVNLETYEVVAVKKMKRKFYYWEECMNLREVKALRKLNHPQIIKLKEVVREHNELFFIFECMDHNLYQIMKEREGTFSEGEIRSFMSQMLAGLAHMHKNGYFHRDLKPENLLVTNNILKIADFGLAREVASMPPYTEYVSTRWYRAPEVLLQSSSYTPAVDMWAVGAILAELFASSPLFPGESEIDQLYKICCVLGKPDWTTFPEAKSISRIMSISHTEFPQTRIRDLLHNAAPEAIDLITRLCSWDPLKRPTAAVSRFFVVVAMAEEHQSPVAEAIPGIHDVRIQTGSENFGFSVDPAGVSHVPGIRRVGLRAEIDTSPPFGSVQEAVTRFGGRGSWVPFKLEDNFNGVGEFDIKRMEEHAAELEKDLIVKELETLDVLEALGSTKRIVEDLKRQLHQESLRSAEHLSSDIKEMNDEHCHHNPMSSPDVILMELKQAKMNLGKTMDDLVMIQSSVETLNKKMKEEKDFLDKTRAKLSYGFGGAVTLAEELSRISIKPQVPGEGEERFIANNTPREHVKIVAETNQNKNCLRTAEMRLVAARKMEEAARAAEALAIAEIAMLSSSNGESEEDDSEFCFPEPPRSPITPRGLLRSDDDDFSSTNNSSRRGILKKLEEASEGVKQSKQALEAALNRVEIANVKQLEAENAFRGWTKGDNFTPLNHNTRRSFFSHLNKQHEAVDNLPKPVLKSNVSMRDVLRRKQVPKEDVVVVPERQSLEGHIPRRNANLSQMLKELKHDIKFSARAEKEEVHEEKQFVTQRRKFGFIHITLPMQKQSKKKSSL